MEDSIAKEIHNRIKQLQDKGINVDYEIKPDVNELIISNSLLSVLEREAPIFIKELQGLNIDYLGSFITGGMETKNQYGYWRFKLNGSGVKHLG